MRCANWAATSTTWATGYPPLRIAHSNGVPALALNAPIRVRGDVSSQFLTALLMALPLAATQSVVIEVVGELISKPYIAITLQLLARFGIQVQHDNWQRFTIPAGSRYQSPGSIHVEADASSASYFIALGAIASSAEGQNGIKIQGVGLDSIQGDIRFVEAAQAMGAKVTGGPNWLEVQRGAWPLKAIDLDCNHIPDAAMTLAVMALYATGTTTCATLPAGASRKPTASPPWPPSCASWGPPWRKAPTTSRSRHLPALSTGKPPASTPMTTTAWPCASHWRAFNPAQPAGAH
jgi:5-enolpyruvylshikimate-3-phosphate synthase